ncbi:MAG: hypothetical protein FJW40_25185 [Acidobacteria bacterium]|nr:hypothetical protein [Acidobacteriota bacterium]
MGAGFLDPAGHQFARGIEDAGKLDGGEAIRNRKNTGLAGFKVEKNEAAVAGHAVDGGGHQGVQCRHGLDTAKTADVGGKVHARK